MNDSDYIWYSFTDPGPRSGASKFNYERIGYVDDVEVHRETRPVWAYSRAALDDLIKRWRRTGSRPSLVGNRTYLYSIKE